MSSPRNPVLVGAAAVVLLTVAIVPFMHRQLDPAASFEPALITALTVFDIMSVYLLLGDFRDRGELRYLVMAMAYVWSLTVMLSYALALPLAFTADAPFAVNPSTAAYLYLTWQCGFPLLLSLAWAPWPARFLRPVPAPVRVRVALGVTTAAVVLGGCVVTLLGAFGDHMPVLVEGLDTTRMTSLTAPFVLALVAVSLVSPTEEPGTGPVPNAGCRWRSSPASAT